MVNILFLIVGLIVGALSGLVGIGGGILVIPILVYGFRMSQHKAQGTSLGALLAPIGILAFLEYYRAGNVDVRAAVLISIGFLAGGFFGGRYAQLLSETMLRRSFAALLIVVAVSLLLQK